jgi:8-amino-7-oxononanoate synthase
MSQVIPIVIGENQRSVAVARELQQAGFDVRAIRPPTVPAGTARLRISVNQGLSESILDQLVDALHTAIEP